MYVRWKTQRKQPAWARPGVRIVTYVKNKPVTFTMGADGFVLHVAQLVECRREHGHPRQHVVAHLGGIAEWALDNALVRSAFWAQVLTRLAGVSLTHEQREAVLAQIAARVPLPLAREQNGHATVRRRRALQPSERLYWTHTPAAGWRLARRPVRSCV